MISEAAAMTEMDYIIASNLVRVRIAGDAMSDVLTFDDDPELSAAKVEAMRAIYRLAELCHKRVKIDQ
jgi:hypothetical protein